MKRRSPISITVTAAVIAAMCAASTDSRAVVTTAALKAPEVELASSLVQMDNLLNQLHTSKQVTSEQGLGPQDLARDQAFERGFKAFHQKEFIASVREFQLYLTLAQMPQPYRHLQAMFYLARANEEAGFDHEAIKYYLRYVNFFLTAYKQDFAQLEDVLRHLLPIAVKASTQNRVEFNQIMSALTHLSLPSENGANVLYLAAKTAANVGDQSLGASLVERTLTSTPTAGIKARALYFKALLALTSKDFDQAERLLNEAAKVDDPTVAETKDLINLALGRLAAHRGKPNLAIEYYSKIAASSPSFHNALFERVFAQYLAGHSDAALSDAKSYLAAFPAGRDAFEVRGLLAYLNLKSGNVSGATRSIDDTQLRLKGIAETIDESYRGRKRFTQEDIQGLYILTEMNIEQPKVMDEANRLFSQISELARRIADSRGQVRNALYTMGRMTLDELHPAWVRRTEQLSEQAEMALAIGERIAATEKHIFATNMTPAERAEVDAAETRRTRMAQSTWAIKKKVHRWASLANYIDINSAIAKEQVSLDKAEADLASARFLASENDDPANYWRRKEITILRERVRKLKNTLHTALDVVRTQKISDLVQQSPHQQARELFLQQLASLHDQESLYKNLRNRGTTPSQRFLSEDAAKAWSRFDAVTKEIHEQIGGLEKTISTNLKSTLNSIHDLESRHQELTHALLAAKATLESRMGREVAAVLADYDRTIDAKVAQNQKWKTDLEWLALQKKMDEQSESAKKYDLEAQMLKETKKDLDSGVQWTWPDQN